MDLEFADEDLARLYADPSYRQKRYGPQLVRAFRKKVGLIRASRDDLELRHHASLHLEQLKGDRKGTSSIRLTDQFRLILRFETRASNRITVVIEIVDYH